MYFQWYRYCFSKYFTFQGRASRTEYWSFTIINLLILWVFWFISKLVDIPEEAMSEGIPVFPKDPVLALIFGSLYLIFCIAIFFPSLAVTVRRLHDRNHSGFWVIAQLIPLLNLVVLLMLLLPSSPYPNYYGLRAPRFPGEKIPEPGADIYGPYGTVAYRPQSNGDETVTQQNQNTPAKGSVMDEIMHENLANADAQAGIEDRPAAASPSKSETHRPMRGEESSLVARLNKLSGK